MSESTTVPLPVVEEPTITIEDTVLTETTPEISKSPALSLSNYLLKRHNTQIMQKPLPVDRLFLAAHTILLSNASDFAQSAFPDLCETVDAVLTYQWASDYSGLPKLTSCFRIYSVEYDAAINRVIYGKDCKFAKDGAFTPETFAKGPIFDPVASTLNLRTFLQMDSELEAAAAELAYYRGSPLPYNSIVTDGPLFTDVLLGFEPSSLKDWTSDVPTADKAVLEALQDAAVYSVRPDIEPANWAFGYEGTITEIETDDSDGYDMTIIVFDDSAKKTVQLPSFATLKPYVTVGSTLNKRLPMASLEVGVFRNYGDLAKHISENALRSLMRIIWENSRMKLDGLVYIPNKFVSVAQASKYRKVLRDMSMHVDPSKDPNSRLGRVYHDADNRGKIQRSPAVAPINVWHMGGLPSRERLTFNGHGCSAELYTTQLYWRKYFECID